MPKYPISAESLRELVKSIGACLDRLVAGSADTLMVEATEAAPDGRRLCYIATCDPTLRAIFAAEVARHKSNREALRVVTRAALTVGDLHAIALLDRLMELYPANGFQILFEAREHLEAHLFARLFPEDHCDLPERVSTVQTWCELYEETVDAATR